MVESPSGGVVAAEWNVEGLSRGGGESSRRESKEEEEGKGENGDGGHCCYVSVREKGEGEMGFK